MSDNTPTDDTQPSNGDAPASAGYGSREPEFVAPVQPDLIEPTSEQPEQAEEPLVIDYDSINANLNAAERDPSFSHDADRVDDTVSSADADAASLALDYAPAANTGSTAADNAEPVPAVATVPVAETPIVAVAVAPVVASAQSPAQSPAQSFTPPPPAVPAPASSPIYVQAPIKPKTKSNRGGGILIALLATVVFAILYAVAAFIIIGVTSTTVDVTVDGFTAFAALPVFYLPIIFFFLAYSVLIALVNRAGWWAHVLFGFLVGVVVYFSYIGAAMLGLVLDGRADGLSTAELGRIVGTLWLNPGAIAAGLIAREVPIWAGAWIARRGRRVTARNIEAHAEYERLLADGPQVTRP